MLKQNLDDLSNGPETAAMVSLRRFGNNLGVVVIHQTNKPFKGQAGDFAYLGSGSAEWANWARAALAICDIGSHEIFELHAGKRGSCIGWKDVDGKPIFERLIGHVTEPGGICWRDTDASEVPAEKTKRLRSFLD